MNWFSKLVDTVAPTKSESISTFRPNLFPEILCFLECIIKQQSSVGTPVHWRETSNPFEWHKLQILVIYSERCMLQSTSDLKIPKQPKRRGGNVPQLSRKAKARSMAVNKQHCRSGKQSKSFTLRCLHF